MLTEGDDGFFSYTAAGISTDEEAAREVAKVTGIEFTTNNLRTVRLQLIGQLRKNVNNLTGVHSAGITARGLTTISELPVLMSVPGVMIQPAR